MFFALDGHSSTLVLCNFQQSLECLSAAPISNALEQSRVLDPCDSPAQPLLSDSNGAPSFKRHKCNGILFHPL